jgi:ribonucleotide reductase alpha subunit
VRYRDKELDDNKMKRKGSFAIYLEPWHADIFEFLDLRKNQGKDEIRARDLFLALWTNDIFMTRVDLDEDWSLMCPHECSGLTETWGKEFDELYLKYESEGRYKKRVKAREVWNKVLESQIETGTPYVLYKDSINEKSNQANIGIIRSSNLCLDGNTIVHCKVDGEEMDITMKNLDNLFKKGHEIMVLSRDVERGIDEWCLVDNSGMTNGNAETIKVSDEFGNYIICTEEHEIWTENRGYVMAKNLKEDDILKISDLVTV